MDLVSLLGWLLLLASVLLLALAWALATEKQ